MSDITFDMANNKMQVHQQNAEPWRVTLVDTGDSTMTGGRLKRVESHLQDGEVFCFTYGDSVADVDITLQLEFHKNHGKLATVTAVQPPGRFGALELNGKTVAGFKEKPTDGGGFINGGFFILSPECLDILVDDETSWEDGPLSTLANDGQLMAFEHKGFWRPMDTLRDKNVLEEMWVSGNAPWNIWE